MIRPSLRCGLTEFEQIELSNVILCDGDIWEYSSDEDDYLQLLCQRSYEIRDIKIGDIVASHVEGQIVTLVLRGISTACSWQHSRTFAVLQEEFCNVCGPQFSTSSYVVIVDMFQKYFD
jgi:hypothetical protein